MTKKKLISISALLLILLSLPLALFLMNREQDLRQRAAEPIGNACYGNTAINILVDKSLSMNNNNKMSVLKSALSQFVTSVGNANSDIYIGIDVFGAPENPPGGAYTELDFVKYATNQSLITNKINSLSVGVGGGTYMRKGFEVSIAKINAAKARPELQGYRFVTVVFSDGIPEVSGHWGSQCSAQAGTLQTSSYICFAIAQDPRTSPNRVTEMKQITDKLYAVVIYSSDSGTRDYPLNSQLIQLMRDIADDPDSTYYFDATTSDVNELNSIFQTIPQTICPSPTPTMTIAPTKSPTPIACSTAGGSGGSGIGGTNISVKGGDGGVGGVSNGVCKPGTNGYSVNASNYCTAGGVVISWPTTNSATYYKLLIDGQQVYNGNQLTYTAKGYSVGPQHNIVLYAGNTQIGDFNPSTGGYFQINSTPVCTTPTLTPTRTPTPSPTRTPTPTFTPSPTPVPQATKFNITLLLHGIGNSGDNANPNSHSLSNKNPLRKTRTVTIELYNATDQLILTKNGSVEYNSTAGNFQGTIDMGNTVTSQNYIIRVKSPQYLKKRFAGFTNITAGQTVTLPTQTLVTGDINNDDSLSILDYNILIGCYSDFGPAASCTDTLHAQADLTDDGSVNQFDYNLFLRDFSVQSGL